MSKATIVPEFETCETLAAELGYSIQHVAGLVRSGRVTATQGKRRRYLFNAKEAAEVRSLLTHAENKPNGKGRR